MVRDVLAYPYYWQDMMHISLIKISKEFKDYIEECKSSLPYYGWDDDAMKVGAATALPFLLLPGVFPL
jgi:hypothetical protein